MSTPASSIFDPGIAAPAAVDSFRKLDPRRMARNPVMFVTEIGAAFATILFFKDLGDATAKANVFAGSIAAWLWFTVLFANFAEAMAEGRGKAQAATLRKTRAETTARRRLADGAIEEVPSSQLAVGDQVVVTAGEIIPADGDVIEGIASVDESAITGESAPVIRESGGDRSAVTGGTRVLSDEIVVRVTTRAGESFLDRMIALVEGASRQKTPNEIALDILLAGLTIILLLATVTLQPYAVYSGAEQPVIVLIALLVCLIPTTIGALLSAIGIAGMDRLVQRNVLAMSGRAVEAAGDCSTLLLDKTGTITLGNRQATDFIPAPGVTERRARRRGPALEPRRRDARGSLDRRAREGALRPARPRAAGRRARPVHGADAHERRRGRRPQHPQGRRRRDPPLGRGAGRHASRPSSAPPSTASPPPAARRSSWPRTAARSASSTSRTSSRRASASASQSCGRWASAP